MVGAKKLFCSAEDGDELKNDRLLLLDFKVSLIGFGAIQSYFKDVNYR